MKLSAFLFFSFLALNAQALVLGELKGTGKLNASYGDSKGSSTFRTADCTMSFNIVNDGKQAGVSFSYFDCGALGLWNDWLGVYDVEGNQLVNKKGQVVGSIDENGSFSLNIAKRTPVKYTIYKYDYDCRPLYGKKVTLNLDSKWAYTFTKRADGGYDFTRKSSADKQVYAPKRPHPRCRAQMEYKKATDVLDLQGSVK
ncbi:hypothetical protein D3C87_144170 [compost metagenome]